MNHSQLWRAIIRIKMSCILIRVIRDLKIRVKKI